MAFSEFGFPKSHAAAFGLLAYQSAWIYHYHPVEYCAALFNNQPMGFYSLPCRVAVFILLEDEGGMSNVIVHPDVYDRDRLAIRGEPLLWVKGKLAKTMGR